MHVDRILAARDNQAAVEAESASGSRSFAINAAKRTPFRSSPRRAVQSCVAIALARAARNIAELSKATRHVPAAIITAWIPNSSEKSLVYVASILRVFPTHS